MNSVYGEKVAQLSQSKQNPLICKQTQSSQPISNFRVFIVLFKNYFRCSGMSAHVSRGPAPSKITSPNQI